MGISIEEKQAKEDEENSSSFGLLFIAEDGIMYHYGFSIKSRSIESEWLIVYYTKRPSMLFERYKMKQER